MILALSPAASHAVLWTIVLVPMVIARRVYLRQRPPAPPRPTTAPRSHVTLARDE
jgi:hypothetical protein